MITPGVYTPFRFRRKVGSLARATCMSLPSISLYSGLAQKPSLRHTLQLVDLPQCELPAVYVPKPGVSGRAKTRWSFGSFSRFLLPA